MQRMTTGLNDEFCHVLEVCRSGRYEPRRQSAWRPGKPARVRAIWFDLPNPARARFHGVPPEQAAQLTNLHVEHHVRLGFEGYSVFLAPDYLAAFVRHPRLAPRIESGQVGLSSTNCMGKGRARLWDMPMVKESWTANAQDAAKRYDDVSPGLALRRTLEA